MLPYDDAFFDCVVDNVCSYSNIFLDIKCMFNEMYRVLDGNGRLLTVQFGKITQGYKDGTEIETDTFKHTKSGNHRGRGTAHFLIIKACMKF